MTSSFSPKIEVFLDQSLSCFCFRIFLSFFLQVVKADHSKGGWRSVSKAQKGKAGRGWGLKDGLLAGNPPPAQVFGRLQQDQGPSHGGQVAKFEQAAIGGGGRGSFGADSEQGRDFNLLSAFEQFVEGSQGPGKYGGKPGSRDGKA